MMKEATWKRTTLGEDIHLISGQHLAPSAYDEGTSGIPYLTGPADFAVGRFTTSKRALQPKTVCEPGDILLTVKGSGTGTLIVADQRYCISRQLMAVRPKTWDRDFVYQVLLLHSDSFQNAASGLIPGITREHVLGTVLHLPSVIEQKAIAAVLTTWDRGIRQLTDLIAAKVRFKQGLMQQLLTGKRRFKEFGIKPWREYQLGDLFTEREETNCVDLPLLSITADRGVIPRTDVDRKDTSNENKSLYKRIAPGDIGYNTMRMWQGVAAVSRYEGIVSPAYTICIPGPSIDVDFAGCLFKYPPVVHLFYRFSQGLVDDTLNLKFHHFAQIRVRIPSVKEQKKIALVFSKCDEEIEVLQKQLDALKQQKKGLMQKLLTGQVRVKL